MKCPRCPGHWKIKEISGHPRKICDECGYLDSRESFINDIYHGPPMKTPLKFDRTGDWHISRVRLVDEAGNVVIYEKVDLENMGISVDFQVID